MTRDEQWLLDEKYAGKETIDYESDRKRLAFGEPLGYVIGSQPFLGLKIYLDSKPLIPRPETEWWVEKMLEDVLGGELTGNKMGVSEPIKFLDLCAGSGAIGCAVLKNVPNAKVYFGEIDPTHEPTIQKNIRENNLDASPAPLETPTKDRPGTKGALSLTGRADIRIGDLFAPFGNMKFDIIAVNPPYIPSGRVLEASVANYEPARALYSGVDGLDVIRRIALDLPKHLAPNGTAWIECDSPHMAIAVGLFEEQGFKSEIRTDQYDMPRSIVVSFP